MRAAMRTLTGAVLLVTSVILAGGRAEAGKPQPPPPPPCTDCWLPATGINGGTPAALEWVAMQSGHSFIETVYAAVNGGTSPGVYKSTNGGEAFTLVKSFPDVLALATGLNGRFFAATSGGLYYTSDFRKWTKAAGGLPNLQVWWVGSISTDSGFQVYATADPRKPTGGLYRSVDNGANWTLSLIRSDVHGIDSSLGCAIHNTLFAAQHYSAGSPTGPLVVSHDDGANWVAAGDPSPSLSANAVLVDCWVDGSLQDVYFTSNDTTIPVWKSSDFGLSFGPDDSGMPATHASSFPNGDPGNVGTLGAGVFTRICASEGCGPWTQYNTNMLGNLNLTDVIKATDPVSHAFRFVAATPGGIYFYEAPAQ